LPGICTQALKGPLLPLHFAGQVSVVEGGRGGVYDGKDERPAPLRGLSPLSLMLPLNHTDTPPVSFCEAAPVPHVSLWGKEQTSQNITGRRHSKSSRGGKKRRSRVHRAPRPRPGGGRQQRKGATQASHPPTLPSLDGFHPQVQSCTTGKQITGRGQSQSSEQYFCTPVDQDQRTSGTRR